MLRNRNIYIEDFFGATGTVANPRLMPNSPSTATEIQFEPVNEITPAPTPAPTPTPTPTPAPPDETTIDPTLADQSTVPATYANPTTINNYGTPLVGINPYLNPYIIPLGWTPPTSTAVIIDDIEDYGSTSPFTSGGGGGGFGNGAEIDESTDMDGADIDSDGSGQQEPSNKKRVVWLIVIAIAVYLGYKYFKKK